MQKWDSLKTPSTHIHKLMNKQSTKQVLQNHLRLKASIKSVMWLAKQACTFRGHDDSVKSSNRGNFIEMLKLLGSMNEDIGKVVLKSAPGNVKYTSPMIQKELLNIIANNIWENFVRKLGMPSFVFLLMRQLMNTNNNN